MNKQFAGKYLAKGTYGCVYKPALKCNSELVRNDGIVSKIMKKSDAVNEVKKETFLKIIDPTEEFTISTNRMCEVGNIDNKTDIYTLYFFN